MADAMSVRRCCGTTIRHPRSQPQCIVKPERVSGNNDMFNDIFVSARATAMPMGLSTRNIWVRSRISRSACRAGREAASTGPLQASRARMSDPWACAALPAEGGHSMRCAAYAGALTLPAPDPNGARMPGTHRVAAWRNRSVPSIRADRLPSPRAADDAARTTGWPDRDSPTRLIRRPCRPACAAAGRSRSFSG